VNKLEFCLFAIGNLIKQQDRYLSKKLIKLADEAHYYYPEDQKEEWHNSKWLYKELFTEFENFQKEKLNN
jgi:hypothetical protein